MNKKGSIALALLLVIVFVILGAAILLRSMQESAAANRMAKSTCALWVAEAGVQQVLYEYNYNSCHNMVQVGTNTYCSNCTTCGGVSKTLAGTLSGYGDYDVTLNNAATIVQSTGSVPSRTDTNKVTRNVQTSISRPAIFGNGIYAQGQVTLVNNSLVDSYNSSNGAYGGANIHSNGNVGTNGTSTGIVTIDNNATVKGSVATGPGGTVTEGNGAVVTGTVSNNSNVSLPSVVVPTSLTSLSSSGTLSLGNGVTQTISAGDYKYTNASLSNNSVLNVSGNVRLYFTSSGSTPALNTQTAHVNINVTSGSTLTIYSDGIINFGNNVTINTASQTPANFLIYSTYTGSNGVTVNNNGTSYAGIYAPNTDVDVSNNAGFYGAVVGKTVTLDNNGEIHYDEALSSMANPFQNAIISNWQEF